MTVIALTADGRKIVQTTVSGPSSYATGGYLVRVPELNRIDAVILAFITGGYKIGGYSISGNAVTVVVHYYDYPATSAGASTEVPNATDLSGTTITLIVIGA
jgi:hypothetical protein